MHFAHSLDNTNGHDEWHKLQEHLIATGEMASEFAKEFDAQRAAKLAGLLHDLGKYSAPFQERLSGSGKPVDHSTAGAQEVVSLTNGADRMDQVMAQIVAYCIAGHHTGLANYADLQRRLAEKSIAPLDKIWLKEIEVETSNLCPPALKDRAKLTKDTIAFQTAFLGRMIFSCLVDADFKDTERFYSKHQNIVIDRAWPDLCANIDLLLTRFNAYMDDKQKKARSTPLNALRQQILQQVRSRVAEDTGLFTLTVPTGGGKTLASLGFALDHAKEKNLRRIIYAIPFTSIIDQNAAIFREVLGENYVLEHHASIDDNCIIGKEARSKLRLAMEDWAAPVIVTTNVQLFESLFSNSPSSCRKLHNLACSVIILDEAQTLPFRLLRPCLAALDELARNYGITIIFCTATQPAFDARYFDRGVGLALENRELAPDPSGLAQKLQRTKIAHGHELDDTALITALSKNQQALIIVNGRQHALNLYNKAQQEGLDGLVHLTTRQYAVHRRQLLAQIRQKLKQGEPCRVIATSLVEAGVDVDFPRVWRAEAGLDQIAQAAGRCNREGLRSIDESIVTVFKPKESKPPREIAEMAAAFRRMAHKFDNLLAPEAIRSYFEEIFWSKGRNSLDQKKILDEFGISAGRLVFNYKNTAQNFQMIESGLKPIIIAHDETVRYILDRLNNPASSPGKAARELQPYIVQVPPRDFENLRKNERVGYHYSSLWGEQFAVLQDDALYKPAVGLLWEQADLLEDTLF